MIFAVHFQGCTKDFHCGLVHSFRTHWHGPFSDLFLPGTKKWKDEKMNEKNNKNEQHSVVVVVVVVFLLNAMEELDKTGKQLLCVCVLESSCMDISILSNDFPKHFNVFV